VGGEDVGTGGGDGFEVLVAADAPNGALLLISVVALKTLDPDNSGVDKAANN
jgi:hypothetical protein